MSKEIREEILRLHQEFMKWYNGQTLSSKKEFNTKIGEYLEKEWYIVFPDGSEMDKNTFCKMVYKDHNESKDFAIQIKGIRIKELSTGTFLARYEEWQFEHKKIQKKIRTASILRKEKKSKRIVWVHIHESPIKIT